MTKNVAYECHKIVIFADKKKRTRLEAVSFLFWLIPSPRYLPKSTKLLNWTVSGNGLATGQRCVVVQLRRCRSRRNRGLHGAHHSVTRRTEVVGSRAVHRDSVGANHVVADHVIVRWSTGNVVVIAALGRRTIGAGGQNVVNQASTGYVTGRRRSVRSQTGERVSIAKRRIVGGKCHL